MTVDRLCFSFIRENIDFSSARADDLDIALLCSDMMDPVCDWVQWLQ